jgi:glycosyltransferase involved in cell wall biosynthesis
MNQAMNIVSVIVPCRNERAHIASFCADLARQTLPDGRAVQVLIADGRSDDGTRELLQSLCAGDPRLQLIDNPQRIVSSGLNRAIDAARGEVVVRMDVHTAYAPDYIAECVAALQTTGATCVGGPWRPVGDGWPQAAIALAFQSRFGSGGAASRRVDFSGPVDTVYLGAWRRDELLRLGGFDESLVRNQDDELNLRIVRAGGSVWQSANIRSSYTPRGSFAALFRQFHQYGYWKVPVIRKHRLPASPRHLAPFALLAGLAGLAALAPWLMLARAALVGVLSVYALTALFNGAALARAPHRLRDTVCIAAAIACMHLGYGLGFGLALVELLILQRTPGAAATRLTR